MKNKPKQIGTINETVVSILNLSVQPDTPIFLGQTNLDHMKDEHPEDFKEYGDDIEKILANPDYISEHPNNGSIQYIKVYRDKKTEKRVLVAVRATKKKVMFARSLFVMSDEKVKSYEEKGFLKVYKK